ncbi:MAG: hypothetical protein COA96_13725 [SAR86 cluster bacterium]|uniref:Uncharacterized protein n=1 Tax=SAR86 cluster bacterium TaxID=2030880 RepID=A0A2A5ATI5_9GAMM|nr:MAG: hypothetical protein COA96_13725 [SAR86 cluster bacterium]
MWLKQGESFPLLEYYLYSVLLNNFFATNLPHAEKGQLKQWQNSAGHRRLVKCGNFKELLSILEINGS